MTKVVTMPVRTTPTHIYIVQRFSQPLKRWVFLTDDGHWSSSALDARTWLLRCAYAERETHCGTLVPL